METQDQHGNSPSMQVAFHEMLGRLRHQTLTLDDLKKKLRDPSNILVVGMFGPGPSRPGVKLFFNRAEVLLYDPCVKWKNDRFELVMELWQNIIWAVGVFPAGDRKQLEVVARKCGLRFANGVPQVWHFMGIKNATAIGAARRKIKPDAQAMFPLPSHTLFTLENIDNVPPLSVQAEEDQLKLLHEQMDENARTRWWPEIIGEEETNG